MGSLLSESKTRPVSAPDSALTVVAHVPIQTQQAPITYQNTKQISDIVNKINISGYNSLSNKEKMFIKNYQGDDGNKLQKDKIIKIIDKNKIKGTSKRMLKQYGSSCSNINFNTKIF